MAFFLGYIFIYMQIKHYNYGKKMFTRRAKPIRKIGDLDNQHPNKWSSTVLSSEGLPVLDHSVDHH